MTSSVRLLVLAVAVLALPGCGDDSSPTVTPTPTPVPTPPPPRAVLQNTGSLPNGFASTQSFTTDRAGTLDATVDYTFTTSNIVVWIARGSCTIDQLNANSCDFAATSFAGAKPRRVSVTNAPAGTYALLVGNAGPQDESISYQVVLSPNAASASAASVAGPAGRLSVGRMRRP